MAPASSLKVLYLGWKIDFHVSQTAGESAPCQMLTNVPHGDKGKKRVYELRLVLQDSFFKERFL